MTNEKKSHLYTKKGDSGKTHLASMKRVSKAELRLETYGTVDELNAHLGVVRTLNCDPKTNEILISIQNSLFIVGSDLAFEEGTHPDDFQHVNQESIAQLEKWIDELDANVPALRQFILPGGSLTAAHLHVARTICRRAERLLVRFLENDICNPMILPFINRLSDLLFILARYENAQDGIEDIPWRK